MTFNVYLVQQGISAATHPVTGKSGKLYGTATASPEHGGVMFMMTDQEYLKDAHDIVGNTSPHQQWVPLFVSGAAEAAFHKCDRCSEKAIARKGPYYYCGTHAPSDAVFFEAKPAALPPNQPPPAPAVDERVSAPITERTTEAAKVTMPPPPIGTAGEHTSDSIGPAGGPPKPEPPAEAVSPPRPKLDPGEPAEPAPPAPAAPQPDKRSAVEVVTEKVIERITPMLEEIKNLVGKNAKPTKAKKKVTVNPELVSLRARAKELKINTFGKGKETLRAEIAAAETPPA